MNFSEMNKQQRVAWGMLPGSILIALYLLDGFRDLLVIENGTVSSAPGLLMLCVKAAVASAVLEIGARLIRKGKGEAVDTDERDMAIRAKATMISGWAFGGLVCAAVFSLIPWGMGSIQAVSTATMGGALICLLAVSSLMRNFAEIALYRWG